MRIGLVTPYYPPHTLGGAEWSVHYQAHALRRRGHHVVVITPNYGAASHVIDDGVVIYRYRYPSRLQPGEAVRSRWAHNPLVHVLTTGAIVRIARAQRLDVLHATNQGTWIPTWWAARRLGVPSVAHIRDFAGLCPVGTHCQVTGHGQCSVRRWIPCLTDLYRRLYPGASSWAVAKGAIEGIYRGTESACSRWHLRRFDRVVCTSESVRQSYLNRGALLTEQPVEVMFNFAPNQGCHRAQGDTTSIRKRHGLSPSAQLVVCLGRRSFAKGTDVLEQAWTRVHERCPSAQLVLMGSGTDDAPHAEGVTVLGLLPHDEALAVLAEAKIAVIPSRWGEPFGRVSVEAMQAGVAVIASAVGGLQELIRHEKTGVLVPPESPEALASAIQHLLDDDQRRSRLAAAGQRWVNDVVSEARLVQAWERCYQHVQEGYRESCSA